MTITLEALRQVVEREFGGVLRRGAHDGQAACVWEAVNFAKGNPWGDQRPDCVAPDIYSLLLHLNDSDHWRDDAERTEVLLPAVVRALGTAGDSDAMQARLWRLADVAMRVIAADALGSAGCEEHAARLRARAEITDRPSAARAAAAADAARSSAAAAADAARWAADAAARSSAADAADAARWAADAAARSSAAADADAARWAADAADAARWSADAARWSAAASADGGERWRRHVGLLLVAAGLSEEVR